jgi:hypothetical protein
VFNADGTSLQRLFSFGDGTAFTHQGGLVYAGGGLFYSIYSSGFNAEAILQSILVGDTTSIQSVYDTNAQGFVNNALVLVSSASDAPIASAGAPEPGPASCMLLALIALAFLRRQGHGRSGRRTQSSITQSTQIPRRIHMNFHCSKTAVFAIGLAAFGSLSVRAQTTYAQPVNVTNPKSSPVNVAVSGTPSVVVSNAGVPVFVLPPNPMHIQFQNSVSTPGSQTTPYVLPTSVKGLYVISQMAAMGIVETGFTPVIQVSCVGPDGRGFTYSFVTLTNLGASAQSGGVAQNNAWAGTAQVQQYCTSAPTLQISVYGIGTYLTGPFDNFTVDLIGYAASAQ